MSPGKLRCVVVDDDHEFLARAQRCFVASGFDVDVLPFADPVDAIACMRQTRVDVVFTAYLMPEIDGLQLIAIIRTFNEHVPIYMASGVPIGATALARGATGFFAKATFGSHFDEVLTTARKALTPLAA